MGSECYNWAEVRRRLAMSNGRLRLEPSDAGSCFRVGNTKGWISDVDGESAFKMATVFLDLERAHGAQHGGITAQRRATNLLERSHS